MKKIIDTVKPFVPSFFKRHSKKMMTNLRALNAEDRLLPDFIVIGTQKGGTKSLYNYLIEHPQILPGLQKQAHYFDRNAEKPLSWYKSNFPPQKTKLKREKALGKKVLTGEATPDYILFPDIPSNIKAKLPEVKLILILRDPVKRAHSEYNYLPRYKEKDPSFASYMEKELKAFRSFSYTNYRELFKGYKNFPILYRGLYIEQIEYWLQTFTLDQILILSSEDLFKDSQKTFDNTCAFLNLEKHALKEFKVYNAKKYQSKPSDETVEMLRTFYAPYNKKLFDRLGKAYSWS